MILNRFKKNRAFYYAVLTAQYTGLRVSEVFGLNWDDIDLENKTLTVNKNIFEEYAISKQKNNFKKQTTDCNNITNLWFIFFAKKWEVIMERLELIKVTKNKKMYTRETTRKALELEEIESENGKIGKIINQKNQMMMKKQYRN